MKYLAACVMVKNEAHLIREWMAFHRAVGFDHLIIVDDGSTDGTCDIVQAFGDADCVTLERWIGTGNQMDAFNNVASRLRNRFHWCAFLDADEFLYPSEGSLKEVISRYEDCSVVGAHWLIYGSSGFETRQDGFVTETYLKRAPVDFHVNRHIKSIVKLSDYMHLHTSHLFVGSGLVVDEMKVPVEIKAPHGYLDDRVPTCNYLRINHYYTRSKEDFEVKVRRGKFNDPGYNLETDVEKMVMFNLHDRNEIFDDSAMRYSRLMRFYAELPPAKASTYIPDP